MNDTDEPLVLYPAKPKLLRALHRRARILLPVSMAVGALSGPWVLAPLSPLVCAAYGGLFYGLVVLLAWGLILVWTCRSSAPLVTLTRQGIAFRLPGQYGSLGWEEVERVTVWRVRGTRGAFDSVGLVLTSPRAFLHLSPTFFWRLFWIVHWPLYLMALLLAKRRASRVWNMFGAIHFPEAYLPMSAEDFYQQVAYYRGHT